MYGNPGFNEHGPGQVERILPALWLNEVWNDDFVDTGLDQHRGTAAACHQRPDIHRCPYQTDPVLGCVSNAIHLGVDCHLKTSLTILEPNIRISYPSR